MHAVRSGWEADITGMPCCRPLCAQVGHLGLRRRGPKPVIRSHYPVLTQTVPAALLELKDRYGVIRAQIPTAIATFFISIVLMYFPSFL
jgi:hypothetical protein